MESVEVFGDVYSAQYIIALYKGIFVKKIY